MGSAIKGRRVERGLTQADLAKLVQVDPMTVSRWERGVYVPEESRRKKLAAFLGGTPDDYREEMACQTA